GAGRRESCHAPLGAWLTSQCQRQTTTWMVQNARRFSYSTRPQGGWLTSQCPRWTITWRAELPEGSRLPHATSVWLTSQVQRCPNYEGVSDAEIRHSITPPRRDANFSLNARDARIGWAYPTARSGARPFVRGGRNHPGLFRVTKS